VLFRLVFLISGTLGCPVDLSKFVCRGPVEIGHQDAGLLVECVQDLDAGQVCAYEKFCDCNHWEDDLRLCFLCVFNEVFDPGSVIR
jgi:hypothetical protein